MSRHRVAALAAFVLVFLLRPVAISTAWVRPHLHAAARDCCYYKPTRLAHGEVWTAVGSAFLLINPHPFGSTVLLTIAVLLPLAVVRGTRHAGLVFAVGHLTATLGAAVLILPGAALHVAAATRAAHMSDVGMSAGLAAAAGALSMHILRRRPAAGALAVAAIAAFFWLSSEPSHYLVQGEHLAALATGALLEWTVATRSRPVRPVPVPYPGALCSKSG
jgi:hypothetical protein